MSLSSYSSTGIVYGGIDTSQAPNLKQAMGDVGFQVNADLWDYYSAQEKNQPEAPQGMTPSSINTVFEPDSI